MLGVVGLWRAVIQRARVDWPVLSAAWLLLLCATTLLAAAALYGDTVALGGIRRSVEAATPAGRSLLVRTSATPEVARALDPIVSAELTQSIEETGGEVQLVARSAALDFADRPSGEIGEGSFLATYAGLAEHAELVAGRWPEAGRQPIEATLSEAAAGALGIGIGDDISLVASLDEEYAAVVRITGLWSPRADDPYWRGDRLDLEGTNLAGRFRSYGPLMVERADLEAAVDGRRLDLQWRAIPDTERLRADGLDRLRVDVQTLRQRLGAALPSGTDVSIDTDLPAILEEVSRSTVVSRSGILVLTIQFAVLAGYAILLVAGMLIDRRRGEVALLRSRGATTLHLILMAFGEAILLAIPAAAFAPLLAVGIVRLLGILGPLGAGAIVTDAEVTPEAIFVSVGTAAGCVVALTLPTALSGVSPGRARAAIGRGLDRTLGQRLGLDVALLVLAGVALWQLQLYGAPLTRNARGILGADPLLVAAPAIGLLAGALVATRIIPRSAELAEKLFERRRGFVGPLGARQLARRPLRYTRSALLLMLAAALGTFAAAYGATWTRSQVDRATYEAAGDIRLLDGGYAGLPGHAVGGALRAIDGVRVASPVARRSVSVGRAIRDGELVAVDAGAVPAMSRILGEAGPGEIEALLGELVEARPEIGAELPAGTRRVAITIDAALRASEDQTRFAAPDAEIPPGWIGIEPAAVVRDADGRIHRFAGPETGTFDGVDQRLEVPLIEESGGLEVGPTGPLTLLSVEFRLTTPGAVVTVGRIELRAVEAGTSPTGREDGDWTTIPWNENAFPLEFTRRDISAFGSQFESTGAGSTTLLIDEAHGVFGFDGPAAILQLRASADERELPAIASASFAEAAGARVGDTLQASILGRPLSVRIVGIVRSFAPLDPATSFLVVDGPTHDLVTFLESNDVVPLAEWWLAVDDEAAPAVLATLRQPPVAADDVIGRLELADRLATDPVALGVIGALGLGSIAALAFAAIGFVVSATSSVTERLGEFALLQAVGLSARQLSTWVSLENAFLLLFGLVAGSGLGLLLSWLVLPFATLTERGATPVPTPVVEIPWLALIPLYALAGVTLFVVLLVITHRLPRSQLSAVLRARDE